MSVKINLDSLFCLQIYFTRNSLNTYARWRDTFVTNYTGAQLQFTCLHGGYLCFWQDGNTTDVNKEQKSRNYLEPSSQTCDNRPRDAEARDCATGCRSLSPIDLSKRLEPFQCTRPRLRRASPPRNRKQGSSQSRGKTSGTRKPAWRPAMH